MSNSMKIFVLIICLIVPGYVIYNKVSNSIRIKKIENYILKECGSLNDLKLEDIENTPIEQLKKQYKVYSKLYKFLDDDYSKEKTKIAQSFLPNFYKIKDEWIKSSNNRIAKFDRKKKELHKKFEENYICKMIYELYLRKMKGIKDENIIKQKLEKSENTIRKYSTPERNIILEEDYDEELVKTFYKLFNKEIDEIHDQAYKKAKEDVEELEKNNKLASFD